MASIVTMVGAAIINAVAFTTGNALYDKYGRNNGNEERIRHDKAIEDQQKAVAKWNEKRAKTLDWINNQIRQKNDGRKVFEDVDSALEFYNETHPDGQIHIEEKPHLDDFYKPSIDQNYYELFVAAVGGGIIGYVAFKLI